MIKRVQKNISIILLLVVLASVFSLPSSVFADRSLKVQMYNSSTSSTVSAISPCFKLVNIGEPKITLSDVKIRYYYTIDGEKPQNFSVLNSTIKSDLITGTFVKMQPATDGADYYLEIGFTSDVGKLDKGESIDIHVSFDKGSGASYNQTDDYSFNVTGESYVDWDKTTSYISGELEWGVDPLLPTATPTPSTTPTPSATPIAVESEGVGLKGEYFDNINFTAPKFSRVDPVIDFNWKSNSPDQSMQADTFSVRWTGMVEPKYTEEYTFFTVTDDGVRLWVNNVLVIDKWRDQGSTQWGGTISLAAGQKYDIKMEYYENYGSAVARVLWSSARQRKQVIPQSQLYPPDTSFTQDAEKSGDSYLTVAFTPNTQVDWVDVYYRINSGPLQRTRMVNKNGVWESTINDLSNNDSIEYYFTYQSAGQQVDTELFRYYFVNLNGTGLQGEYYDNMDFTGTKITRIDPTIDFDWSSGSPNSSIGADTFSVRWTGMVEAQYTEKYTFYTTTDDGVRLWVNNVLIIDKWVGQSQTEWSGTINLTAGQKYDIKMEYYENTSSAVAKLLWSSASQTKQTIPQGVLYPPNSGTLKVISHGVQTVGDNRFISSDTAPMVLKFQALTTIDNPVIGVDLTLKKSNGSDSGFIATKLTDSSGLLNKSLIKVYLKRNNNTTLLDTGSLDISVDTVNGWLKFKILQQLQPGDEVEVRYPIKISASDAVIDQGIENYLNANALSGVSLYLYFQIEYGNPLNIHSKDSPEVTDKSAFGAAIVVEAPNILE